MQKIVIGRPMKEWLEPTVRSYLQWNGFLPELVSEINEISFEIAFAGSSEDYRRFSEAVQKQAASLSERGFDPIDVKLTFLERFSAKHLQEQMRGLRKSWAVLVPTQSLFFQRDELDGRLEEELTMEQALALIDDYVALIHQIQLQRDIPETDRQKLAEMRKAWEAILDLEVKR